MVNHKQRYWFLIKVQFVVSLFFFSVLEIFENDYLAVGYILLVIFIGIYASIVASRFQHTGLKKFMWLLGTLFITFINLFFIGFLFGQLVAMLFGVWSLPPQD